MPSRSRPAHVMASAASLGRLPGSFAVRRMTNAVTSAATDAGSGGSGRSRWARATSSGVPVNGRVPVRHSYATIPREYRSLAGPAFSPTARSGAR